METLKERIIIESDSIAICRSFSKEIDMVEGSRRRVALLSSYTIKGLGDCLKTKAFPNGILLDIYEGEYSQWRQEILGNTLYDFDPEIIFILVDFFGMEDDAFFGHSDPGFDIKVYCEGRFGELSQYLQELKSRTKAKIVVANGVTPAFSILGVLEGKSNNAYSTAIRIFNQELLSLAKDDTQVFVFDMDQWLGKIGKKNVWCSKYYYIGDMKLAPIAIPVLAHEFMDYVVPLFGKKKKCIVVDLDNTLWGGVIGEDGLGGIQLGPTGEGQSFFHFQKLLLHFKRRGLLLAICSKNNESDVKEIFDQHPHMVLKENDFVAKRINWEDKAVNIKSIADELNIGLDSFLFIDDDPTHTMSVKQILHDVDVITLPKDRTEYLQTLLQYRGLSSLEFTDEDSKRTDMYISDNKRKKFESEAVDMDSFLKSLNITLYIKPVDEFSMKRSAQLTQKTNQFNLTTYRYTEEDISSFIKSGHRAWTLEVRDRFGDYGIVGLCIVKDMLEDWTVDTFLLSCRVLGRKIEFDFFSYVMKELKSINKKKIKAIYIPTKKNMQVSNFYQVCGFKKIASDKNGDVWQFDDSPIEFPTTGFTTINNTQL